MYGTIFNMQVKSGHEQAFLDLLEDQDPPEGMSVSYTHLTLPTKA